MADRVERRAATERPTELAGAGPEAGAGNVALGAGPLALHLHPVVFPLTLAAALAGAAWLGTAQAPPQRPGLALAVPVLAAPAVFAVLCVVVALAPWGRVRLGGVAARPEYSTAAWLAMMALAGIGLPLVVQGTAEPVAHLAAALAAPGTEAAGLAPLGGAAGDGPEARRLALAASLHHWGPLPWALPASLALALGLASYNRGLPLTPRSALYPLLGARAWGWAGHAVDAAAAALTLLAVAVALSLGAAQLGAALGYLTGRPIGEPFDLALIGTMTGLAGLFAWRGVQRGLRPLAVWTAGLAGGLVLFLLLTAPGGSVLGGAVDAVGAYGARFAGLALPFGRDDAGFMLGWTLPRWAWWLAWTPGLGVFLARISRGRTVRGFLAAALLVPGLAAALWLGAFGSTAIRQIVEAGVAAIAQAPPGLRVFLLLQELPFSAFGGLLALLLMALLFVGSAAPAVLSVDTMTTAGRVGAPPVQRLCWALLTGAAALLVRGGASGGWMTAALWAAPVLVLFLALAWWSALRTLATEPRG